MGRGRLIALYGYPGSGKDEIAKILVEKHGFTKLAFADPIRERMLILNPIIHVKDGKAIRLAEEVGVLGWDKTKRKHYEVRRLLQVDGTEAGRDILGENVWVNALENRIHALDDALAGDELSDIVISDLRFPNEYQLMKRMGGDVVKVWRDGCGAMGHESEQHYDEFRPDYTIENNGTLEDLEAAVVENLLT